jgi:methylmalonyl-CoA/ethylmalonyl-CoA epimerase
MNILEKKYMKEVIEFVPHHTGLSVPDLKASIEWYQDMLGFTVDKQMDMPFLHAKIAFMKNGEFRIELFEVEGAKALPEDRRYPSKDLMTHGWKHLSLGVKDVKKTLEILKKKGVDVALEGEVNGEAMAFLHDNSGNLIELNKAGFV